MTTLKKTKNLTMMDLMSRPTGPSEYHIVQEGQLEYAGSDPVRAGKMMSWLRSYRWGEVHFFKNGELTETLPSPRYTEPPPPEGVDEIPVTAAMVKAARDVLSEDFHHPSVEVLKRMLRAALRAYYDNKGNGS